MTYGLAKLLESLLAARLLKSAKYLPEAAPLISSAVLVSACGVMV